ncbi:hypothetical protein GCM10028815_20690 [Mariniluteicoccus flavus]
MIQRVADFLRGGPDSGPGEGFMTETYPGYATARQGATPDGRKVCVYGDVYTHAIFEGRLKRTPSERHAHAG